MRRFWIVAGGLALVGCGDTGSGAEIATLYRNSPLDPGLRVHFSSFNADEGRGYNLSNCEMVARLLNANGLAAAEGDARDGLGFWCEAGPFTDSGTVPLVFRERISHQRSIRVELVKHDILYPSST